MVVTLLEACRDTSESHNRVMVVETMGRGCGDIALNTAIATGAIAAVIPEEACDEAALMAKIRAARADGQRSMLVVVSEGVFNADGTVYGEPLTKRIEAETGCEARFLRLAHVQRGGVPTLRDRQTAAAMGVKAVELLLEGKSNLIVSEWDGKLTSIETTFALAADRMYKKKLKDGDLDKFSAEEIEAMKAMCQKRADRISGYYAIANSVG
jgi:6-phosphofructokinase 1